VTRSRANGEGSIFPYRNGYAAYSWVSTPTGKRQRKYVYGRTREVVHEKWIKLMGEARKGAVSTTVPKLGDYLTTWLSEIIEPGSAPATYAIYESHVRLHISPRLGNKRLDKLGVRDVQLWINTLRKTCLCCTTERDKRRPVAQRRCCAVKKCCQDYLSDRSVGGIRAVLRSALSQAMREELISRNVAMSVTVPTRRKHKASSWTSEEARAFLENARSNHDPMYAAYVLTLTLGLRKGEVLGLLWDDIDLSTATLAVNHQLQRASGTLYHRETKTEESEDALPLVSLGTAALRWQKTTQERAQERAGDAWQKGGWVFTTRYGTPIEPRNFSRYFQARCEAAGVRRITVHDARRTCATILVDLDVHPRIIMKILRHTQIAMTMDIYAQASSKSTREALQQLGEELDRHDSELPEEDSETGE